MTLPMPLLTMISGAILVATGPLAYVLAEHATVRMVIPFLFGVLLLACGILSKQHPDLRKMIMHVAVLLGPIGCVGAIWSLNQAVLPSSLEKLPATIAEVNTMIFQASSQAKVEAITKTIMAIVCGQYFVLCIISFVQVRANRAAAAEAPPVPPTK